MGIFSVPWKDELDLLIKLLTLFSVIIGVAITYFKIAKKIGEWETIQEHTVKQLAEQKETIKEGLKEQKEATGKVVEKLTTLGERVYELFGQLKPKSKD